MISDLIVRVGFPVVVAGILLWFVLVKFQETVGSIANRMQANADAIEQLVGTERETLEETKKQTILVQQLIERRHVPPPAPPGGQP
jgi:hypothetical protein